MQEEGEMKQQPDNFRFTSLFIQIVSVIVSVVILIFSKYTFLFFVLAMLPSVMAIFFEKGEHRCFSATICSFNLIGVMPYVLYIMNSTSSNISAKMVVSNPVTWMTVYGSAIFGVIFIWTIPDVVAKIYISRAKVRCKEYNIKKREVCDLWGINYTEVMDSDQK